MRTLQGVGATAIAALVILALVNAVYAKQSSKDGILVITAPPEKNPPFTAYESGGNCVYIAGYGSTATIAAVRRTPEGC